MFNSNLIKGKWEEIKGDVRKAWGKLTDDEIEKTKGDMQALSGLLQQRYGMAQEEARRKLSELVARFGSEEKRGPINEAPGKGRAS